MKKFILVLALILSIGYASAAQTDTTMKRAIAKYKSGNYTGCLQDLETYVKRKPTGIAYYYIAMSYAQAGFRDEAIANYDKVISITADAKLRKYAQYGKKCLEMSTDAKAAEAYGEIYKVINNRNNSVPQELKDDLRKKHLEYLRNEINAGKTPNF